MQRNLEEHNGISIGDIVKLSTNMSKYKRAKVENIYKEGDDVRYIVKVSNGDILVLEATRVAHNNEACNCEVALLMRQGCQCGGY